MAFSCVFSQSINNWIIAGEISNILFVQPPDRQGHIHSVSIQKSNISQFVRIKIILKSNYGLPK